MIGEDVGLPVALTTGALEGALVERATGLGVGIEIPPAVQTDAEADTHSGLN